MEEEWLKDTYCKDPADNKEHNIAEVPLKDMFCPSDVQDKLSTKVRMLEKCTKCLKQVS